MFRKTLLATIAVTTWAHAASITALPVTTPAAQQDQATLCNGLAPYPTQFIWDKARTIPTPRSALPSDNLVPRIEQWHAGASSAAVVYASLDSNPATCGMPNLPYNPVPGGTIQVNGVPYPYATVTLPNGNVETVYSDVIRQALANIGCGPFGNNNHTDIFRLWLPGDTFKIYPAIYPGVIQMHPSPDYWTGGTVPTFDPTNITLQGIVQNGIRPIFLRTATFGDSQNDSESGKDILEIQNSQNITFDNIDFGVENGGYVSFAVVFDTNSGVRIHDDNGVALSAPVFGGVTTISNARIFGGELAQGPTGGANGVAGGDSGLGGTFILSNDEIYDNGGSGVQDSSGPGHNVYMPAGLDPNFTVIATQNYSHDAYFGHLFKSRAQRNIVIGNYFQGGLPQGGIYNQAEAYGLDIPNAGILVAKDNIFTKNMSGVNSNGFSLAYGEEGLTDDRTLSLDVENNTFVTFAHFFDNESHWITPFFFFNFTTPNIAGFPVADTTIRNNAFVGYCPAGVPAMDYRGDVSESAGFSELRQSFHFTPTAQFAPSVNNGIVGTMAYGHVTQFRLRRGDDDLGAKQ